MKPARSKQASYMSTEVLDKVEAILLGVIPAIELFSRIRQTLTDTDDRIQANEFLEASVPGV